MHGMWGEKKKLFAIEEESLVDPIKYKTLNRRILLANEIRRGKLVRFFVLPSTCLTCCGILKKYVISKE